MLKQLIKIIIIPNGFQKTTKNVEIKNKLLKILYNQSNINLSKYFSSI